LVVLVANRIIFSKKIPLINGNSFEDINNWIDEVESYLNFFKDSLEEEGVYMNKIILKRIDKIENVVDYTNDNITKINNFITTLNKVIEENRLSASSIFTISNIKLKTSSMSGDISVSEDKIVTHMDSLDNDIVIDMYNKKITYSDKEIELWLVLSLS